MAQIINTRSPFYIKAENASLVTATLQIYIYEGTLQSSPPSSDLKYTISKSELENNNQVVFEISELVRDYIDVKYNGEYDSYCVWVRTSVIMFNSTGLPIGGASNVDYIATDGYGCLLYTSPSPRDS